MEERLNKYISKCGVCSRRKADEYIMQGRIKVNEKIITELGYKVNDSDIVKVDEKKITLIDKNVYIMVNKPIGYVSTAKEQFKRPCVIDLIKDENRVFPVGRLDMYSEGLLILTNDGEFVNNIIHPSHHVSKTYIVTLTDDISDDDINKLREGIDIGGYVTKKAIVSRINKNIFEITIYEGKNRQIRRMCEVLGYKVSNLKRIKIGNLELGNVKRGKYRYLSDGDIKKIFGAEN